MKKKRNSLTTLCKNIKYLRNKYNVSKRKMARIMRIFTRSLDEIENMQFPPRISCEIIFRLHYYFGVYPTDLLQKSLYEENQNESIDI